MLVPGLIWAFGAVVWAALLVAAGRDGMMLERLVILICASTVSYLCFAWPT